MSRRSEKKNHDMVQAEAAVLRPMCLEMIKLN